VNKKKKIGITQRVDKIKSYDECRDALDQRLIDWVVSSDYIPVPIPNSLVDITLPNNLQLNIVNWLSEIGIDTILLSGGNNIGHFKERDLTEKNLLLWAKQFKKPVLGICRGMEMMGVHDGVQLKKVEGHVGVRHKLKIKDASLNLLPSSVNSYHDLALKRCPDEYEVLAVAEDDNIEAIKHNVLPWEGWMWHPERETTFNEIDQVRFKKLVNNGK